MSATEIVLIIAAIGYVLGRRMLGQLLEARALLVLPAVLTVVGFTQLHEVRPVSVAAVTFAGVGVVASVLIGLARGATIALEERDGRVWMRYRWSTVCLWVLNFAVKAAMIPVELLVSHSASSAAGHSIVFAIGLGILAESAVVLLRAMRSDSEIVWRKGKDGAPHQTNDKLDSVRSWVRDQLDTRA